ncbi:AAA family ATPase [Poseidonocella sp. HB161398]|uniref:AAA family ATPase n=1 Tax=Poseidonocella sp. HB161398 TaxID=2320855 RepID=UPI001107AC4C|nr:AAA family ATPase [Poseidonocella sp. HB161398]
MRLRSLTLDMFGQFAAKSFDFGEAPAGAPDFHIVHGPNEAGKTTTMEGYLRLLYGFRPKNEPYDFRHGRSALRVSGVLETGGEPRGYARVPGRSGTLLDAAGAALPEGALGALLGGLDEAAYRSLFCLDDATIESGGEEIVRAQGEIGRLLFSAAAGIGGLSEVLDAARGEAEALYMPRRRSTEFARLKGEIAEVSAQIEAIDLQAPALKALRQQLAAAEAEEARLTAERKAQHARRARLAAEIEALPLLAALDGMAAELAAHPGWPRPEEGTGEHLVQQTGREAAAKAERARLLQAISVGEKALESAAPDPAHLALAEPLEALAELAGRQRPAAQDLPRRRARLVELSDEILARLAGLGITGAEALSLPLPDADTLSALDAAFRARATARADAGRDRAERDALARRRDQAAAELAVHRGAPAPGADLAGLLACHSADRLAPRHAAALADLAAAGRRAGEALDALALKGQVFAAPPVPALSSAEAEARLVRLQEEGQALAAARTAASAQSEEIAALEARIDKARRGDGPLDDAAAAELLAQRDRLWAAHLAALDRGTAEGFAAAMQAHDRAQSGRLAHAAELGALREMETRLAEARARQTAGAKALEAAGAALKDGQAALAAAARDSGLEAPLDPAALPGWLRRAETAAEAAAALARAEAEHRPVIEAAAALMAALAPHVPRAAPEFGEVLEEARRLDAAWRAHDEAGRALEAGLAALERDLAERQAALDAAEAAAARAGAEWQALAGAQFGGRLDPEAVTGTLQPLNELAALGRERAQVARQVATMEEDAARFAEGVAALAGPLGLAEADPLAGYQALAGLLATAERGAEARKAAADRLEADRQALAAEEETLAGIAGLVADLGRDFPPGVPVATLSELRQAVARAGELARLGREAAALEQRICAALGLRTAEEARTALEGRSQPELAAELAALEAGLEPLEAGYRAAIEAHSAAQRDLAAVSDDAEVALLAERRAVLELQLAQTAERHLALDLGLRLAEEAIRRYRDRHRGAMMAATEAAFAELTNGGYPRLETRREGQAETLFAIDSAGTARQAQDMSKGTRFQLYLALRAAAHAQMAAQGTCLPFFCDDIFETFDEERTRAACRVMARIGRTGQAIYLTHHRHVVEIAREVCGEGLRVHELDPARTA